MNYYSKQLKNLSDMYHIDKIKLEDKFRPFYIRVFERDYDFNRSRAYNDVVIGVKTIDVLKRYLDIYKEGELK